MSWDNAGIWKYGLGPVFKYGEHWFSISKVQHHFLECEKFWFGTDYQG